MASRLGGELPRNKKERSDKLHGPGPNKNNGFCECGCGQPAPIAKKGGRRDGIVRGQPQRFVKGHHAQKHDYSYDVDGNGCWIFRGHINKRTGYGMMGPGHMAHRVYYEKYVGPIPAKMDIDHVQARGCKSRACVNPDHLEPVTRSEHNRRTGQGRHPQPTLRKLTDDQVREARSSSETHAALARRFGVRLETVRLARRRVYYKDVA